MNDKLYMDLIHDLLGMPRKNDAPVNEHKVFIISGAPGSGKTKYVADHKDHDDLVCDFDYICAALGGT